MRFYAPYKDGWTKVTKDATARYGRSSVKATRASEARPYWPARYTPPFHDENPGTSAYQLGRGASTTQAPLHVSQAVQKVADL